MADALDLGSSAGNGVRVRPPPLAYRKGGRAEGRNCSGRAGRGSGECDRTVGENLSLPKWFSPTHDIADLCSLASHRQNRRCREGGAMKRTVLFAIGVVIGASLATAPGNAQDKPRFRAPPGWELANLSETRSTSILEFVPKGQPVQNWQELFSFLHGPRPRNSRAVRETFEQLRALREQRCPGVTEWEVLSEDVTSLVYLSRMTGSCDGKPPEFDVVRLLHGRRTFVRAAYSSRSEIADSTRQSWLSLLNEVALVR
jgi:hypothetical protein